MGQPRKVFQAFVRNRCTVEAQLPKLGQALEDRQVAVADAVVAEVDLDDRAASLLSFHFAAQFLNLGGPFRLLRVAGCLRTGLDGR